jgi:hypothetical protein
MSQKHRSDSNFGHVSQCFRKNLSSLPVESVQQVMPLCAFWMVRDETQNDQAAGSFKMGLSKWESLREACLDV